MAEGHDFLSGDAVETATRLLGWRLYVVQPDGTEVGGEIIETEAYRGDDAASHSYKGETPRTKTMFGPAGHIYVYFTYGMHYCMNIVTGPVGSGEAVLIRALALDRGIEYAREQRGRRRDEELANGPAKVCQALGVTLADDGRALDGARFRLDPPLRKIRYEKTPRIGISRDKDRLWRFIARD
jgi:DNA-3-methyladenine glycosylase